MALHDAAGKMPVHVKKDVPGFVGNRLQHALWREAIALVEHGICDAETVDTVIKASVRPPARGAGAAGECRSRRHRSDARDPQDRAAGYRQPARPVALSRRSWWTSGKLGFKSGEGFRNWSADEQAALRAKVLQHLKKARAQDA